MAELRYSGIGISALSACVPSRISKNAEDLKTLFNDEKKLSKVIESTGIIEKRIAENAICSSDLCFKAAERLIVENQISREEIDVLIFLSQSSDYPIPATAPLLQERLKLSKTTAAFDLRLGCSGYLYALSTAFSFAQTEGVRKVLLLNGETLSKKVSAKDFVNAPLYGDAGTATLIEKGDYGDAFFSLCSDGRGGDMIKILAGGERFPINENSLVEKKRLDGSIAKDSDIFMQGMNVFNFAIMNIPTSIESVLKIAGKTVADIDYCVFHQANKFMTDFLASRVKLPTEKILYSLEKYGNTSSSSIPLTMVSELSKRDVLDKRILLSGFGAGLSWGSAVLSLKDCKVTPVFDY